GRSHRRLIYSTPKHPPVDQSFAISSQRFRLKTQNPAGRNGSITRTPVFSKSSIFRVASVRSYASALAAIRLSLIGIACPCLLRLASNSAQRRPVVASHGRHVTLEIPVSNH